MTYLRLFVIPAKSGNPGPPIDYFLWVSAFARFRGDDEN